MEWKWCYQKRRNFLLTSLSEWYPIWSSGFSITRGSRRVSYRFREVRLRSNLTSPHFRQFRLAFAVHFTALRCTTLFVDFSRDSTGIPLCLVADNENRRCDVGLIIVSRISYFSECHRCLSYMRPTSASQRIPTDVNR